MTDKEKTMYAAVGWTVKIITTSGKEIIGKCAGYTPPYDNDPEIATLDVKVDGYSGLLEITENELASIERLAISPGKPRAVGVEAPAMDGYFIMERNIVSKKVFCPLLNKEVEEGYCWELCNIANDDILLDGDTVKDWDNAQKICRDCGRYE